MQCWGLTLLEENEQKWGIQHRVLGPDIKLQYTKCPNSFDDDCSIRDQLLKYGAYHHSFQSAIFTSLPIS